MRKKFKLTVFAIASILVLTACAGKEKAQTTAESESVADYEIGRASCRERV